MAGITDLRTFTGGMNKDIDESLIKENQYRDALNFKLIADEEGNGFVLENAEGNKEFFDITDVTGLGADWYIAGHCFIQPYLVLFVTENHQIRTFTTGNSGLVLITLKNGKIQDYDLIYTDSAAKGYLNFSTTFPIKAVGTFESNSIVKVYWTDSYNELRYANILDSDLNDYTIDRFSFTPDFPDIGAISSSVLMRPEFVELVSGSLKVSVIQYTYQFYSTNGAATGFAPLSPPILIPTEENWTGGEIEEETNYGVRFRLSIPEVKIYDRIRLVALDFYGLGDTPRVRVFGEYEIDLNETKEVFYFNDIGSLINEISYPDFLVTGNVTYKARDLETKDSTLFIGNIKEETFDVDFDARAYRHNSSGIARIYESDLTTYMDIDDGNVLYDSYADIPDNHDCINRYNDPSLETNTSYQYIYRANGSTIGAEGPNVVVGLVQDDSNVVIDISATSTGTTARSSDSPVSTENAAYRRSFQRQEVYRIGIVFHNEKLQASPVKWVCDFKMPLYSQASAGYEYIVLTGATLTANVLGLAVTITDNFPTDAYAWQVVMVPRGSDDRTVMLNALLQTPYKDTTGTHYVHPDPDDTTGTADSASLTTNATIYATGGHDPEVNILISPEINYNQNLKWKSGDFLQYIGYFDYTEGTNDTTNPIWSAASSYNIIYHKLWSFNADGEYIAADREDIDYFEIVSQNTDPDVRIQIGSKLYSNYSVSGTATYPGLHGTVGVAVTNSTLNPGTSVNRVPVVSYRRNVFESQYGGIDYYSRQRNEYIGISDLKYMNDQITTYEGDIFIDMYWYLKQAKDLTDADSYMAELRFPIESTLSTYLEYNESPVRLGYGNSAVTFIRESSGYWEGTFLGDDLAYDQVEDLYQYNAVYATTGIGKKYYGRLLDESNTTHYPTRVRASDTKQREEISDSYTIFRASNYLDVDGKYGFINNLISFKNQLFFWQQSAFGIISVNTRSLIQDNNPGVLALGTGGILERYDYLSETTGNVNDYGIVKSDKFLYWIDNNKSEFIRFSGETQSVSKVSGIQTLFNEGGNVGWAVGVYDSKYNDVIFTVNFAKELSAESINGETVDQFSISDTTGLWVSTTEDPYNIILDATYEAGEELSGRYNTLEYTDPNFEPGLAPYGIITSEYDAAIRRLGTNNDVTLVYNERIGAFVSRASFEPVLYVKSEYDYFSAWDYQKLWLHNAGGVENRCSYYDAYYDSELTVTFNKDYPYTKVFDVVKWVNESEDVDGINQFEDTWDSITFWDDYQHTGLRTLYYQHGSVPAFFRPIPASRRDRTWSVQIPRNIVDTNVELNPDIFDSSNWDETQLYKERMRDKYLNVKFIYDNAASNKVFSVPFVAVVYRKSFR